ncbi:MAG: hypothetical protein GY940_07945 [bacterium]|nr:hypothetical protein [bacterium]
MKLSKIESTALKTSCELNEKCVINVHQQEKLFVYRSRFLAINFQKGFLVIDIPTAETPDAQPLSKGQNFEVFFEYKTFRYLFSSKILEHTKFKINERGFFAFKILIPGELQDGDKREYFRVQTGMRPPVVVKFRLFPKDGPVPVGEALARDSREDYRGEMLDISGGGFAMRAKPGDKSFHLEKGDIINARFKLKAGIEELELWLEVRNSRRYKDTEIIIWGLQFMPKSKNNNLNYCRNKIMRYVTERQREILSQ